jgi:hypothetical protein
LKHALHFEFVPTVFSAIGNTSLHPAQENIPISRSRASSARLMDILRPSLAFFCAAETRLLWQTLQK